MLLRTACPLDCPDTCSIHAEVVDGKLIGVTAAPGNPFTQDFICQKVSKHAERVYSPDRIMTPMRRTGSKGSGQFEPISWDEAVAMIVDRVQSAIERSGPGSVVPYLYNSSVGVLNSSGLNTRVWAELGCADVLHTICAATTGASWAAVYGDMPSIAPTDVVHSKFIVVWGANPTVSNIHLPPLIHRAQENGATVVVVDPRRTAMAKRADRHLAVRPGTDVALAYGMANYLQNHDLLATDFLESHATGVERFLESASEWDLDRAAAVTGIDAGDIAEVAHQWATTRPSVLRFGWGQERNRNGGSSCRAVLSLPVLMGHFGEAGAGVLGSTSGLVPLRVGTVTKIPGYSAWPARRPINMNTLGAVLCDGDDNGKIDVLFVQGANPAIMNPTQNLVLQGLGRDDLFTVVHDQVLTDTCAYADIVLPATTHYEAPDMAGSYGSYVLQTVNQVIEPVGQSVSNTQLAEMLAKGFGLDMAVYGRDVSAQIQEIVFDPADGVNNVTQYLGAEGICQFGNFAPSFGDPALDGRARLSIPELGAFEVPRYAELHTPEFPFTVISPATHRTINSMFGEFNSASFVVRINPGDADGLGLASGAMARVFNELGSIQLPVEVDGDQRPGVVTIPKGIWMKSSGGLTVNALVPDSLNDLADGACFNDTRVQIERAA